ncbi:MAG: methyltransferase domain-containing protein [Chloroflexi bacterium]|nr:methyltransferase domain-containing protein [Chloroflexota bacterium]
MDIVALKRLDSLWTKVYPYLAAQVMEGYGRDCGAVLEMGPFSGGISLELSRLHPGLNITIADERPEVVEYLRGRLSASGLSRSIAVDRTDLNHLTFANSGFDLAIFRGAFFFLDKAGLLQEIFRVLRPGGVAFIGGGYGKGVPAEIIAGIAGESRVLNERLGRRKVGVEELAELVRESGLTGNCEIIEEGGVWLIIRK